MFAVTENMVQEYFQWANKEDLQSERFTKLSKEEQDKLVENALVMSRKFLEKQVKMILDKEPRLYTSGYLHPSNKYTRKLFQEITGINLPSGAGDSSKVAREYVGNDVLDRMQEEAEQARKQKEQEEKEKEEAKRKAQLEAITSKMKNNEAITGDELVDVAKGYGITINIRTIGTIRSRINWITKEQASVTKNKSGYRVPDSVFILYRDVLEKIAS